MWHHWFWACCCWVVSGGILWTAGSTDYVAGNDFPKCAPAGVVCRASWHCWRKGLFRYILHVARKVKSNMLEANAACLFGCGIIAGGGHPGITGSLMGYKILDPIAALVVGLFILRMGLKFTLQSLPDLMDRGADEETIAKITQSVMDTPGGRVHDLKPVSPAIICWWMSILKLMKT